jgi:hypothetical protein
MSESAVVLSALFFAMVFTVCWARPGDAGEELDANRVKEIAAMLEEQPRGLGRPCSDRPAWERLAQEEACKAVIPKAEKLLTEKVPEQPDELFLEFSKNGNRTNWQNVASKRRGPLTPLVLAECLEDKGRFIPRIEELIGLYAAERTWVMPAHDRNLDNFNGKAVEIDLASSALGWQLATADYLLGAKLSAPTRQKLRENLQRRVLEPFRAMYSGKQKPNWWVFTTNNWNAVCLAGVTGTALAAIEDRSLRAEYIAAAEKYSKNFLDGFTPDGYCTEGLGYWNYGFGNFVELAETIRQATKGGVDLMARPNVKAPAQFGLRIEIMNGVSPAFADCGVATKPSGPLMYFANRLYGMGLKKYETMNLGWVLGNLTEAMLYAFPNAASEAKPENATPVKPELRSWFGDMGILVARPAVDSECRMGVALKGGHNNEHHNHNDVGSYVVVVGDAPVLLDPGAETYTARTFSSKRYESKLLNSFGHPVPLVAGQLQRPGKDARAKVLRSEFTEQADTLELDISSAYEAKELRALKRTFVYSREKAGSLSVSDEVEFTQPAAFGTALITKGTWEKQADGSLSVRDGKSAVRVEIDTGGAEWKLEPEEIRENAPVKPTRLGINLTAPVSKATIVVKIRPE